MGPFEHHQAKDRPKSVSDALKDVSFAEAAKAVVQSHMGGRWLPFKLTALVALIFWPVLFYRELIRFNAALFVSEWLKLAIEGVLLFLILEIIRYRSSSFALRESTERLLTTSYINPLRTLLRTLHDARKEIELQQMDQASAQLRLAWRAWKALEFALSDEAIQYLHNDDVRNELLRARLELKPAHCESVLASLRAIRQSNEFTSVEFEEVVDRFEVFLVILEKHLR